MNFEVISSDLLPDVKLIKYRLFADNRGVFGETFRGEEFEKFGLPKFVQENVSVSDKGIIRGMHYQLNPKAQAKLVYCLVGSIYDVVVDIKRGSQTFGKVAGFYIEAGTTIFVPAGFAHGFQALKNDTVVAYKVSEYYSKEHERGITPFDENLNIGWPEYYSKLSQKDKDAPSFLTAENNL
jgi:dTDP-4-dehydrorhamnose 3,5-epimerase